MDDIYLIIIIVLGLLAMGDLIVGVSNDAVNFLTSAVGSKAIPFKYIMILASLGIALGALFSSGLMEVARKGIFNPGEFYFDEIMMIFTAVMLTDILLLDFFNSLGLPTSTTVSIVFELLGAAVFMSIIKIGNSSGDFTELLNYINTSKAIQIILGIILSVVIALTIGAIVQWICRLILTYEFDKNKNWVTALFGAIALASITYFILIKGIKGTPFSDSKFELLGGVKIVDFIETDYIKIIISNFFLWFGLSFIFIKFLKFNIYKIIIGTGTFALALAFAGNDLVNFIGVPIAAYQSYQAWIVSGIGPNEFNMAILASKVSTPSLLLVFSGLVMVLTLWFSKKAKSVLKTSLDLSNQRNVRERFQPNFISIFLVKSFQSLNKVFINVIPKKTLEIIENRFSGSNKILKISDENEVPSFDMVRASVNLIVASVLISIATSYKLPLSTTYVTFMVAMGTSLADRAWGSDSAVYRVAGVVNVISGWFLTALIAFFVSGVIVSLIYVGGIFAIFSLLIIILLIIAKNYVYHKKNFDSVNEDIVQLESRSMEGVLIESADNIKKVINNVGKIFQIMLKALSKNDFDEIKKCKKISNKLSSQIEDLRGDIFYFIKNLEEPSINAGQFYIKMIGNIQDISDDLEYSVNKSFKHLKNGHNKLKLSQIRDLNEILESYNTLLIIFNEALKSSSNFKLENMISKREEVLSLIDSKINDQIERTRIEETSPKNTTLYFNLLLKTKEIFISKFELMKIYSDSLMKI